VKIIYLIHFNAQRTAVTNVAYTSGKHFLMFSEHEPRIGDQHSTIPGGERELRRLRRVRHHERVCSYCRTNSLKGYAS
jgi:hypothetical protein